MKPVLIESLQKSKLIIEEIKNDLSVDLSKYDNDEIIPRIQDLIFFQKNAISKILGSILFFLFLFLSGYFFIDLKELDYIFYSLFGSMLCVIIGICVGLLRFTKSLQKSLFCITEYASELMIQVTGDMKSTQGKIKENLENPIGRLFEGIIIGILLPKIIEPASKIPLFGNKMGTGINNSMSRLALDFKEQEGKLDLDGKFENNTAFLVDKLDQVKDKLDAFSNISESAIRKSFSIINLPVFFILIPSVVLTAILVYLLN